MKYDPILCMMVDDSVKTKDSNTLDKAIRNCDAEGERWITMRGSHVKIDGKGNAVAGNEKVKSIVNGKKKNETAEKSEKEGNHQTTLRNKNKLLKEFNEESKKRENLKNEYSKADNELSKLTSKYEDEVVKIAKSGKSYREAESEVDKTPLGKAVKKAENDKNKASKNYYESLNKLKGMANELMELTESLPKEMRKYEWSLPRW